MKAKSTNIRISMKAYKELKEIKKKTGVPIKIQVDILLGVEK